MLSHKALDAQLNEVRRQERRDIAELTSRNVELEKKLEAARICSARLKEAAREAVKARSVRRQKYGVVVVAGGDRT